jgi:RNA polymerase sigma factor (sigma-70 family)
MERAIEELCEAERGFVLSIAKKFKKAGVDFDDLEQAAFLGFIEAIHMWDRNSSPLHFYAKWQIARRCRLAVTGQQYVATVPQDTYTARGKAAAFREKFETENGRQPTNAETAAAIKVPLHSPALSIMIRDDIEDPSIFNRLNAEDDMLANIARRDTYKTVIELLDELLTEQEKEAIILRHGLAGGPTMTVDEVGAMLGRSREFARQLLASATAKLTHPSAGSDWSARSPL